MEWKLGTVYSAKNGFRVGDDTRYVDGTNLDLIVGDSAMAFAIAGITFLLAL